MDIMAVSALSAHLSGGIPKKPSTMLRRPLFLFMIQAHTMATEISAMTWGMNMTVRVRLFMKVLLDSQTANSVEMERPRPTTKIA